jgi:hypothetical protein
LGCPVALFLRLSLWFTVRVQRWGLLAIWKNESQSFQLIIVIGLPFDIHNVYL